jgi:hypothetical protein
MSYEFVLDDIDLETCRYQASFQILTTPGTLTLPFQNCAVSPGGWTNLSFTTSGNNVRQVPFSITPANLYPLINPGGIVNGATFASGPIAPGSIAAIFGADP